MGDLLAIRLPTGDVWHALVRGGRQTLCRRYPLLDDVERAAVRGLPFPLGSAGSENQRRRDQCQQCTKRARAGSTSSEDDERGRDDT